ncbi:Hydroxyacylglutathione hydrolase [Vulgatibacter incomptus]|uniref:Hydroxyacylglutathione hydrolase n=1 Tax=Vulgatibacter incomptus TaxID=1391653 RepID=A0A0K1PFA8_9BACT|nr:Hydroxyacylglutathione hydrolase [Vulgatibacter incomptus]
MKNSQALAEPKAEQTKRRAFPRGARLKKSGPLVRDRFLQTL